MKNLMDYSGAGEQRIGTKGAVSWDETRRQHITIDVSKCTSRPPKVGLRDFPFPQLPLGRVAASQKKFYRKPG
jgi:hypothetical protein